MHEPLKLQGYDKTTTKLLNCQLVNVSMDCWSVCRTGMKVHSDTLDAFHRNVSVLRDPQPD